MKSKPAANDLNLLELWETAVLKFCKATHQDYQEFLRIPSKEEIQNDIEDDRERDEENVKSQALKNLGRGLLEVADVAVDVAADVFSPVGVCFKAVKLVLKFSAACKKPSFAGDLQNLLLSKGEEVIRIFAPYATGISPDIQNTMSESLKSSLYQLMEHFLSICTDCAIATGAPKPKHLRGKLSMYKRLVTRVIAGDVAAVNAREKRLDDLLRQVEITIPANTHVDVLEVKATTQSNGAKLTSISNQLQRQTSVNLDDSNQTRIKEHLGFNDGDIRGYCRETYESLQESTFPETGKWIESNKILREWADVGKSASNIALALEGPSGSGKTHTCFWLLKSLIDQRKDSENQASRANIAYCFFERPGDTRKMAGRAKAGMSLRDALAGLVLQLTKGDVAFRTYVAKKCLLAGDTPYNGHSIFNDLIMGYFMAASKQLSGNANELESSDTTKASKIFFLFLDGLEVARGSQQDPEGTALVRHIIESIKCHQHQTSSTKVKRNHPFQLRFFISGTKEYLDKVLTRVSTEESTGGVPRVPLCEYNSEDLRIYIEKSWKPVVSRLELASSRPDQKKSKMQPAKSILEPRISKFLPKNGTSESSKEKNDIDSFCGTLIVESGNNYLELQSFFEALNRADDRQLESILWNKSMLEIRIIALVRNSIVDLNKGLQSQDIDVLNEIIPWVVLSCRWPTIVQLEAVLFLKYGKAVKIKDRIEKKYKSLLWCQGDNVYSSTNTSKYFLEEGTTTGILSTSSGQTNNVQKPNRTILNRAQQSDNNKRALFQDTMPSYSDESPFGKSHD